ncbi:hypothetical protein IGB42_04305 [Andreprevotia sp. IGB-42]|nr:hypothetical protein IGB42_04305 [Andreprevotia sp. IGB-42]
MATHNLLASEPGEVDIGFNMRKVDLPTRLLICLAQICPIRTGFIVRSNPLQSTDLRINEYPVWNINPA